MPFIPHTQADIDSMLTAIGISDIEQLFDDIPNELRLKALEHVPPRMSEKDISQLLRRRAQQDGQPLGFLGAGAYEHHIPAAVWEIATRGEYYSAYTPYQAEASQGTLQLIYEYQSMMAGLTHMDVSNASLYEGASALAEAILMAIRANRKCQSKRILIPRTLHPAYRKVCQTIVKNQGIELHEIDYQRDTGTIDVASLQDIDGEFAALVIPQPNFFGAYEDVDALTDWAHQHNALAIAVVNPLSLAILSPPGAWGSQGADIACGEGQPLGIPLASGGPYFGFLCAKKSIVRQMPGRIVARTVDSDGKPGYTLTLQAREQHIRRSKATSNICTNQGLMVTAATIHLSLLGPNGLTQAASLCHHNSSQLKQKLCAIPQVTSRFGNAFFHEFVITLDQPVDQVLNELGEYGIIGGYNLSKDYPELPNSLLVCATETKTNQDLDSYAEKMASVLNRKSL